MCARGFSLSLWLSGIAGNIDNVRSSGRGWGRGGSKDSWKRSVCGYQIGTCSWTYKCRCVIYLGIIRPFDSLESMSFRFPVELRVLIAGVGDVAVLGVHSTRGLHLTQQYGYLHSLFLDNVHWKNFFNNVKLQETSRLGSMLMEKISLYAKNGIMIITWDSESRGE